MYEYNKPVFIEQFEVPTIVLKELIDEAHYAHYCHFKNSKNWIPCINQLNGVDEMTINEQKEKMLLNRLVRKSNGIIKIVEQLNGDQQTAFWITIGKVFGGKVNTTAFSNLIAKIAPQHLAVLNYDPKEIEAYCFGLAGFLSEEKQGNDYFNDLKKRFLYQKRLLQLSEMPISDWKFSRMRPGNFPTI